MNVMGRLPAGSDAALRELVDEYRPFQRAVCRLLAENRLRSGESRGIRGAFPRIVR